MRPVIYINENTEAKEIFEFMRVRSTEPIIIEKEEGQIIVFDYNNTFPNMRALEKLEPGLYIIPCEHACIWEIMRRVLPDWMKKLPVLMYIPATKEYKILHNWRGEDIEKYKEAITFEVGEILQKIETEMEE